MGAVLSGSWLMCGASCAILGGFSVVLGAQLGPSWSPKSLGKQIRNLSKFQCFVESSFGWIFMNLDCNDGIGLAPEIDKQIDVDFER